MVGWFMSILVNVAGCKTGLEAFDLLENYLNKKNPTSISEGIKVYGEDKVLEYLTDAYLGNSDKAKKVMNGEIPPDSDAIRELGYLGIDLGNGKDYSYSSPASNKVNTVGYITKKPIVNKPYKEPEQQKETKERAHITAAKAILEKAQKSDKWRLIQKPFWKMTNSERGDFKRNFSDQREADKFKKEIQFIEQIAKEDRPITGKQKDWLSTIASKYYVSYDKDADKSSTRKLAKDKPKESQYRGGSYEDADMPEYDEKSGTWVDMETGLEISPPKSGFASKSYF